MTTNQQSNNGQTQVIVLENRLIQRYPTKYVREI